MNFSSALSEVVGGSKVRRAGWGEEVVVYKQESYIIPGSSYAQPASIVISAPGNAPTTYVAGADDLLAEDWEVVT